MKGFKQFILRGSVVDLAVGVVVGAAFTGIVNALVKDLITPLIGSFGKLPDFSSWSLTFNGSQFMLGDFVNALVSFLIAATAIYFLVVLPINKLVERSRRSSVPADPTTKKCPECQSEVDIKARRCAFCTSQIA